MHFTGSCELTSDQKTLMLFLSTICFKFTKKPKKNAQLLPLSLSLFNCIVAPASCTHENYIFYSPFIFILPVHGLVCML